MNIITVKRPLFALTVLIIAFSISEALASDNNNYINVPSNGGYSTGFWSIGSGQGRGLNDQEKITSENYLHQGLSEKLYQEECEKNRDACEGIEAHTFSSAGDATVEVAAKMYAMFMGSAAPKIKIAEGAENTAASPAADNQTSTETPAEASKDNTAGTQKQTDGQTKEKDNEVEDYCKYGAMATETLAMAHQTVTQQSINSFSVPQDSAQKEFLYQAARSHKARAQSAGIQEKGWGATTACYAAMVAYGGFKGNLGTTAKSVSWRLGASAFLTYYFNKKRKKQEAYEKVVKSIADRLPGKGDCNPITERNCFCEESTSRQKDPANYTTYCLPPAYQRSYTNQPFETTSCLSASMKEDDECKCLTTNNCFDQTYSSMTVDLPYGHVIGPQTVQPVGELSRGKYDQGALERVTGQKLAAAKNLLKKIDSDLIPPESLSKAQLQEVEELTKAGVPLNLARTLAAHPTNSNALAGAANKIGTMGPGSNSAEENARGPSSSAYYSSNEERPSTPNNRNGEDLSYLKKLGQNNNEGPLSGKIVKFAETAMKDADIHQNKELSLFEIINYRYQFSGREKLGF